MRTGRCCSAAFDVQPAAAGGSSKSVKQKKWKNRKVKSRTLRYIAFLSETFNHPDISIQGLAQYGEVAAVR
jgi:hypothetical protein